MVDRSDQIGVAIIRGDARLIAELLLSEESLPSFVLRALHGWSAGHGPGNRVLNFHYTGKGRPPGKYLAPMALKVVSQEEAVRAVENGDLLTLASYLKRCNCLGPRLRQVLGASVHPNSKKLWQLRFDRPRPGNPASGLRTGLKRALLGHEALERREAAVSHWKWTRFDLAKERGVSERQIDIAIRYVRKARQISRRKNNNKSRIKCTLF
jgi:hypothetical protein